MRGGLVIFADTFVYDDAQYQVTGTEGAPVPELAQELIERLHALGLVTNKGGATE